MKKMNSLFAILFLGTFVFSANISAQCGDKAHDKAHDSKKKTDLVELAASTDFLSTLVTAVKAGDLVETLKGDGPFTVFAPTNEAFAALPEGTLESLLLPENKDKLVAVLTYHVVPGKVKAGDLSDGMMAKTVQGNDIQVNISGSTVKVNQAQVTSADIMASNGVVHVIDRVILPDMK